MALNISDDILARDDVKLRKDKRGEIIRIDFDSPVHVDLCIHDGKDLSLVKPLPDTEHLSSSASHINVYDSKSKKPVLKASFMKAREAKPPDKMRATAELSQLENGDIRMTIEKNQYKIKRNRVKPFLIEE